MPGSTSRLPSVMQAKKAQMEVTLAPIEQPKPVVKKPVPVAVVPEKKEEKKDESQLDITEFVVADDNPEDQQVEVKPDEAAPEGAPVQVEKKDQQEENQWKWKFESLRGNHDKIVEENRTLRDRLVVLEAKFDDAIKKPVTPPKEEPPIEITPEDQERFGEALPFLDKLLARQRRQLEETVVKPLQDKITSLEKNTDDSTKRFQQSEEDQFWQQVKLHVKDVDKIASPQNQKWQEFVGKPVSEYVDETVGAALMRAHKKRDLAKVVKIFADFNKSQPTTVADAYRAPTVSSAAGELPNSGKKPMLALSKREEASLKFRKRQISHEEFTKIAELYREADKEGRVDYTK